MGWAELIISISRPNGKLENRITMNVNVVFPPLSAQGFADIIEKRNSMRVLEFLM